MSRKKMVSRIIFIAAFVLLIGLVLKVTDEIIRAKFIGDSTTIVDGFYAEIGRAHV